MRRAPMLIGCAVLAVVVAVAAGSEAFGRLALVAGLPSLAASLLSEPDERGVALLEAGDYREADEAFAKTGRTATYNRGLSLAATGDLALAVAYFDAVLFANPSDRDARYNREFLARFVPDIVGESNEIDGVAANVEAPQSDAVASSRDILTAATTGWLETLADEPALYLKRRIKAEYERRQDLGLANPPEDTAW